MHCGLVTPYGDKKNLVNIATGNSLLPDGGYNIDLLHLRCIVW